MKILVLACGAQVLLDDDVFDEQNGHAWRLSGKGRTHVARQPKDANGKQHSVWLAREIMGLHRGDRREVDHINRNPLDNQRQNLRIVTHQQNCLNRSNRPGASGVRGVRWEEKRGKWLVRICTAGVEKNLGRFDSLEEAIKARNSAQEEQWGEYAIAG